MHQRDTEWFSFLHLCGERDRDLLQGKENMTLLKKIVYIADYIEPARNKAPRLAEIRKIAFENLDLCMYEILHDTLEYLDDDPQDIDQATIQAYNYYSDLINTK